MFFRGNLKQNLPAEIMGTVPGPAQQLNSLTCSFELILIRDAFAAIHGFRMSLASRW